MGNEAGLFLIGMGVGMYLPLLPEPISTVQPFLGIIVIVIGLLLMIKNK